MDDEAKRLIEYIEYIIAEEPARKVYGHDWIWKEYRARRSHTGGEICLLYARLERLKAKAERRPGSIGARKALGELKAGLRRLKELEKITRESASEFSERYPTEPRYLSEPLNFIYHDRESRIKIFKKPLEIRLPHSMT